MTKDKNKEQNDKSAKDLADWQTKHAFPKNPPPPPEGEKGTKKQ